MKAFGKKTLTLALVAVMVLALGITAFAAGDTVKVGETLTLTLEGSEGREVTWASSDTAVATVSNGVVTGVAAGTATITAEAPEVTEGDTVKPALASSWRITVTNPAKSAVVNPDTLTVGYGTSKADVINQLPKKATVTYSDNTTEQVNVTGWACADYKADVLGDYVFTGKAAGLDVTVTVTVDKYQVLPKATNLGTITVAEGSSEKVVEKALPATFDPGNGQKLTIASGKGADFGAWELQDAKFTNKAGDRLTYVATANEGLDDYYTGLNEITVDVLFSKTSGYNFTEDFGTKSGTLADVIDDVDDKLQQIFNVELSTIEFVTLDDEGGTLYTDDDLTDEVEEEIYSVKEAKAMVFVPDGTGSDYVITYEAVGASYAKISGRIVLKSDSFVVIEASIANTDVLPFNPNELQDALEEVLRGNKKQLDPTLESISGIRCASGGVYVDYDDSISLSKNKKASSSADYYVDPTSKQTGIDQLTYVPAAKASGVVDVTFDAYYSYRASSTSSKLTHAEMQMVLRITINDMGDIVVNVANGGYANIPADEFEDLLLKSKGRTSVLRWVEFEGLPNSSQKGYMYESYNPGYYNQAIKKPDAQLYYYTDPKDGDIALNDLYYVAGTKTNVTYRVEFTIYYSTSSNSKTTRPMTGTMDIVVGASGNTKVQVLTGTMYDSDTFKFTSASQFTNGVSSVTFTGQPVGGKLYENYLTSSQKEVTLNVPYTTGTGVRTLSSVTFVPVYGTVGTCSIPCKVITTANKTINYQVNLTLTRSTASRYFTDVTANSYGSYADSIDFLYKFGIVNGMSTTSMVYSPNTNVTRGQWIAMLYRAAGNPAVSGTNQFTDVPAWCKDAVQWAINNGITNGTSATTFSPNLELNRQTIVTFMYRWVVVMRKQDGTGIANLNAYTDGASVSDWAQTAMKWALKNSYIDAQGARLNPTSTANRAEVADFLHRLLTK